MRLIFLYVRDGAAPGNVYNPIIPTRNFYANRIKDEGYFYILKRMVEEKIVDEVLIFIESNKGPGYINYGNKITGHVMPDIADLKQYIRPDDIIYVRGGFKSWYDHLVNYKEQGHWMLLYAANTGREKWPLWSVVFNDLTGNNKFDASGRFQFDFKKPINPNLFFPIKTTRNYDVCIGASHIHDKKGQWRAVQALIEYKKIFNENLKCIMPGALRKGVETYKMLDILKNNIVNVTMPGMVSRSQLNKIYNRSKLFVHLGGGGQGDRGPLEALRCGTPVMIGNKTRHSKTVYQNAKACTVIPINASAEDIARILYYNIATYNERARKYITNYFEETNGIETVILPEMKKLFNIFRTYPLYNKEALMAVYPSL